MKDLKLLIWLANKKQGRLLFLQCHPQKKKRGGKNNLLFINETSFWELSYFLSKKKYTEGGSKNEILGKNMETMPKHGV